MRLYAPDCLARREDLRGGGGPAGQLAHRRDDGRGRTACPGGRRCPPPGRWPRRSEALADPDDITVLGQDLYTAFQDGVGPQGQPSADGNTDSTVVEFTAAGRVIRQWDIHG